MEPAEVAAAVDVVALVAAAAAVAGVEAVEEPAAGASGRALKLVATQQAVTPLASTRRKGARRRRTATPVGDEVAEVAFAVMVAVNVPGAVRKVTRRTTKTGTLTPQRLKKNHPLLRLNDHNLISPVPARTAPHNQSITLST
jgi:hypothetical protein